MTRNKRLDQEEYLISIDDDEDSISLLKREDKSFEEVYSFSEGDSSLKDVIIERIKSMLDNKPVLLEAGDEDFYPIDPKMGRVIEKLFEQLDDCGEKYEDEIKLAEKIQLLTRWDTKHWKELEDALNVVKLGHEITKRDGKDE